MLNYSNVLMCKGFGVEEKVPRFKLSLSETAEQ